MSRLHSEKISLQKKIYEYLKSKAQDYEGEASDELNDYRKNMLELASRDFNVVGLNNLLSKIDHSDIVYLGDFHTFDQSPRNLKRILKLLIAKNKKVTLALELVHQEHQICINNYLAGHITELEFLEEINYHESWRFPWKHYKVLFDEAKLGNIEIIGLNSHGTLTQRDNKASDTIVKKIENSQTDVVVVLFGEYHIAKNKLPKFVQEKSNNQLKQTIIYQNLDEVYWKLDAEIRDETQVITFSEDEYSIQSSPPWIKYESMIYWFENICDDPEFDFHESQLETNVNAFTENVYDNFLYICNELNNQFQFNLDDDEIENFNLYDYHSIEFIMEEVVNENNKDIEEFVSTLIEKGKSFKIIDKYDYYCSSYSINRLSYLAGLHLFSLKFKLNEKEVRSNNKERIFNFFVLRNVFGYFCSKIINPYRKCDLYLDFRDKANSPSKDQEFNKLLVNICDNLSMNNDNKEILNKENLYGLSLLSRSIGYMLGDILYDIHLDDPNSRAFQEILLNQLMKNSELDLFNLFNTIAPSEQLRLLRKSYF